MHSNYKKYDVPTSERVQFFVRLPKELVVEVKVLALLEDDTVQNLAEEGLARLIEARREEPLVSQEAVRERINELGEELAALNRINDELDTRS